MTSGLTLFIMIAACSIVSGFRGMARLGARTGGAAKFSSALFGEKVCMQPLHYLISQAHLLTISPIRSLVQSSGSIVRRDLASSKWRARTIASCTTVPSRQCRTLDSARSRRDRPSLSRSARYIMCPFCFCICFPSFSLLSLWSFLPCRFLRISTLSLSLTLIPNPERNHHTQGQKGPQAMDVEAAE